MMPMSHTGKTPMMGRGKKPTLLIAKQRTMMIAPFSPFEAYLSVVHSDFVSLTTQIVKTADGVFRTAERASNRTLEGHRPAARSRSEDDLSLK